MDLERTNEELKRTNADLHRQLEKWQNLETKGDAEVETQRKKRMALELQVKDLEVQLQKTTEEMEIAVQKEKRRVEKLKEGVAEWQVLVAPNIIYLDFKLIHRPNPINSKSKMKISKNNWEKVRGSSAKSRLNLKLSALGFVYLLLKRYFGPSNHRGYH